MNLRDRFHFPRFQSIQTKLVLTVSLTLGVILVMNLYIFSQINNMIVEIDSVFSSNVEIVQLKENLELVQNRVYEYLNTKSSSALEDYYRYEQDYRNRLSSFDSSKLNSSMQFLEKNIRSMSESYLENADLTVQAKRGRNVERYKALFEETSEIYRFINSYINELNNKLFQNNSENYMIMVRTLDILKSISIIVFLAAFAIGIFVVIVIIRTMIKPLTNLSRAAHQVADGDFNVEVPPSVSMDEIGVVNNAFGQMVESIRNYLESMRSSMEKEAQMKERELERIMYDFIN
ncbi:MAG: HAMP domain-containing protein, partial [Blautia sp.]|nr:HAMP domain-containing protein [Blautia sp.]